MSLCRNKVEGKTILDATCTLSVLSRWRSILLSLDILLFFTYKFSPGTIKGLGTDIFLVNGQRNTEIFYRNICFTLYICIILYKYKFNRIKFINFINRIFNRERLCVINKDTDVKISVLVKEFLCCTHS